MKQGDINQALASAPELSETPAGMLRTQTQYSTAVQVIRPRNLQLVERKCLEEAAIAGDSFYYSWMQGGEPIEGLTIGAALAMARNFGNCVVECRIEEQAGSYIFYGAFIDLETGFNLVRPFRQNKQSPKKKDGSDTYKGERGNDIIFQIGASKAIRNAAFNAMPRWLAEKVMETAKENVIEKIKGMGIEKAKGMITKKAAALGIDISRIEKTYGKEASWDIEKIVQLSSALRAIEDGVEKAETIFPSESSEVDTAKPESKSMAKVKETLNEGNMGDKEEKKSDTLVTDDVVSLSRDKKNKRLVSINKASAKETLAKYEESSLDELKAGVLTQPDYDALIAAIDERRKSFLS